MTTVTNDKATNSAEGVCVKRAMKPPVSYHGLITLDSGRADEFMIVLDSEQIDKSILYGTTP